jgi:formylglycine-generating enzyme required for sulfatase activity
MTRVFVSYRREDSLHTAGRLFDRLVAKFGTEHVFMDVDSGHFGLDFREVLTRQVAECDAFLAIIGDTWLSAQGPSGTRRLEDPRDFVRIEIEAALSRQILVIPVLVGNRSVPPPEELPECLRELSFRHGLQIRPNPDFHHDTDRLIEGIEKALAALRERADREASQSPLAEATKPADQKPAVAAKMDPLPVESKPLASPLPPSSQLPTPAGGDPQDGSLLDRSDGKKPVRPVRMAEPNLARMPRQNRPARSWSSAVWAGLLAIFILGVCIYYATNYGQIRLEVSDPNAVVKLDGEELRREALSVPIRLRPGQHKLEVKWGDGELSTHEFDIGRFQNNPLRVDHESPRTSTVTGTDEKAASEAAAAERVEPKDVPKPKLDPPRPGPEIHITKIAGIKLKRIPAGEFLMGSARAEDREALDDETVHGQKHHVRITRPFYLGFSEVTQGQYRAVMNENPSDYNGSDDLPVEQVTWFEAVRFCNALSAAEELGPFYRVDGEKVDVLDWQGKGYRLPTEAEWEYACRGWSRARYGFGDDPAELGEHAWFEGNSGGRTHSVAELKPNGFGLHDMQGNVWEWCSDGYLGGFYANSPVEDPVNPPQATSARVIRGGGWFIHSSYCRPASRSRSAPESRNHGIGIRLAASL